MTVLRPMREMLSKEVSLFLYYSSLDPFVLPTLTTKASSSRASIDHLTEGAAWGEGRAWPRCVGPRPRVPPLAHGRPARWSAPMAAHGAAFVVGLQKDFPSTIDALARTVEKMGVSVAAVDGPDASAAGVCALCELPLQPGGRQWRSDIVVRDPAPSSSSDGHLAAPLVLPTGDAGADAFCYGCQTLMRERGNRPAPSPLPPYVLDHVARDTRRTALRASLDDVFLTDDSDSDGDTSSAKL